jgi:hypothetical protein
MTITAIATQSPCGGRSGWGDLSLQLFLKQSGFSIKLSVKPINNKELADS